jgi:hypothetical protein
MIHHYWHLFCYLNWEVNDFLMLNSLLYLQLSADIFWSWIRMAVGAKHFYLRVVKIYLQSYSSHILECGLSCLKQGRGTGCSVMIPLWITSLRSKPKTTVNSKSWRENLQLSRNCPLWWKCQKNLVFYMRFFHICDINIVMAPMFYLMMFSL